MRPQLQKFLSSNSRSEIFTFAFLTALSVLNGQTTIFYIIYFFWFNELICISVDLFFKKYVRKDKEKEMGIFTFGPFFLMGIYAVFIIVFFGFIANWENLEITFLNMNVLFFRNWFFNLNLLFVFAHRIYLNKISKTSSISLGAFTPNMIVLHLSIILGGILMFFVVKPFPDFFSPHNLIGSVIIIAPFLFLQSISQLYFNKQHNS